MTEVWFVCTGNGTHRRRNILPVTILSDGQMLISASGNRPPDDEPGTRTARHLAWDNFEMKCPKCGRNIRRSTQDVQTLAADAVAFGVPVVDIATLG